MVFDVDAVRAQFPALDEGAAHFDGPGGSQTPRVVADAVAETLVSAVANQALVTRAEQRATEIVDGSRRALSDLLGAPDPSGVVFGRSMTDLTYRIARAMAKHWGPDDEVVVSRLDHDGNVRPWVHAAEQAGATVRWIDFDPGTAELTAEHVEAVLSERTRLVAVTAASNVVGTRPPVADIARSARAVGARTYVDCVHAAPHLPIELDGWGADFVACSPYKFFGPHCGAVAGTPDALADVDPDHLAPQPDTVPERFELGTLPYELMAGTTAAVDFIASLGDGDSRRERLLSAYTGIATHEDALRERLETGLAGTGGLTTYSRAARRTPTTFFTVDGVAPRDIYVGLAERQVNAPAGTFYGYEPCRRLGLDQGAVRVGMAPYNTATEVDRLLQALGDIVNR